MILAKDLAEYIRQDAIELVVAYKRGSTTATNIVLLYNKCSKEGFETSDVNLLRNEYLKWKKEQ